MDYLNKGLIFLSTSLRHITFIIIYHVVSTIDNLARFFETFQVFNYFSLSTACPLKQAAAYFIFI